MRYKWVTPIESVQEHLSDVKDLIFWEKAHNPFTGMWTWLLRWSNVMFNGKQEI
jgi:hypothetical protein